MYPCTRLASFELISIIVVLPIHTKMLSVQWGYRTPKFHRDLDTRYCALQSIKVYTLLEFETYILDLLEFEIWSRLEMFVWRICSLLKRKFDSRLQKLYWIRYKAKFKWILLDIVIDSIAKHIVDSEIWKSLDLSVKFLFLHQPQSSVCIFPFFLFI